jgi:hypothetical protein
MKIISLVCTRPPLQRLTDVTGRSGGAPNRSGARQLWKVPNQDLRLGAIGPGLVCTGLVQYAH